MHLRKLTRKSVIGFGRYELDTVEKIITLGRQDYLGWLYYNNSHINLFDDILTEIGIYEDIRIEKPGTDIEIYYKCREGNFWKLKKGPDNDDGTHGLMNKKRRAECNRYYRQGYYESKSANRDRNRKYI